MKTLLTGGAGYSGTHTAVELLQSGHEVVIYDNFSNSLPEAARRVEKITGQKVTTVTGDVRDQAALEATIQAHHVDSVVHLAGKKAVGESVAQPVDYFDNNVNGTLVLLRAMQATDCAQAGLQLISHRLRGAKVFAVWRGAPHFGHEPLWPQQADGGRNSG